MKNIQQVKSRNEANRTGESCNACIQTTEFDKVIKVEMQIWFLSSWKPR